MFTLTSCAPKWIAFATEEVERIAEDLIDEEGKAEKHHHKHKKEHEHKHHE